MHYLRPKVVKRVNWSTLELTDPSVMGQDNKQLYADVVYKAKTKDAPEDVIILLNHERKITKFLLIRILEYVLGSLKKLVKQGRKQAALIYHLTFYNGKHKVDAHPRSLGDYFSAANRELAEELLLDAHTIINVHDYTDEELASHPESGGLELVMKHADRPDFLPWLKSKPHIAERLANDRHIERLLVYMTEVGHSKLEDILRIFEEVSVKLKTSMLTTAEQLRAEGMQQGVQQGLQQGAQRERIEIAKNMLLAMHMDMDLVQRATGLSQTDLASLS